MRCPRCNLDLPGRPAECPSCGTDLTAFRSLDDLRRALDELHRTVESSLETLRLQTDRIERRLHSAVAEEADHERERREEKGAAEVGADVRGGIDADRRTPEPPPLPTETAGPFSAETAPSGSVPVLQPSSAFREFVPRKPQSPPSSPAEASVPREPRPARPSVPRAEPVAGEILFGQKWLLIAGVVLVLFGVGYFLRYSFRQGWVGPAAQVSMAYGLGVFAILLGEFYRRREAFRNFGLVLMGGGIAVMYAAGFASHLLYDPPVLNAPTAFGLMIAVTVLACVVAVRQDSVWLAVLGLIGGFLGPILLPVANADPLLLMFYVVLLNAGILSMAAFRRWRILNVLGFFFTWTLYAFWLDGYIAAGLSADRFAWALLFLNVFFVVYAVVPFFETFFRSGERPGGGVLITVPNAYVALGFSLGLIGDYASLRYAGIATASYALFHFLLAVLLRRKNPSAHRACLLLVAQGIVFLGITGPLLLQGPSITVFWALESMVVFWAGIRMRENVVCATGMVLLLLTVLRWIGVDYASTYGFDPETLRFRSGYRYMMASRWITSASVLAAFFVFARLMKHAARERLAWLQSWARWLTIVFLLALFAVLNAEIGAFCESWRPADVFASITLLWFVFAVALILAGEHAETAGARRSLVGAGSLLLLAGLVKFIFRDLESGLGFEFAEGRFAGGYRAMLPQRLVLYAVSLGSVAILLRPVLRGGEGEERDPFPQAPAWIAFVGLLFLVLNVETAAWFAQTPALLSARSAAVSVLWALFSAGLIVAGFLERSRPFRWSGIGLFIATVGKVFFFDMREVETPYRILSSIVLGLLLIAASYLYHRYRDRLLDAVAGPEAD